MIAMLVLAAAEAEKVKPLRSSSLLITIAIIAAICGAILLAGFGYFSPPGDGDRTH